MRCEANGWRRVRCPPFKFLFNECLRLGQKSRRFSSRSSAVRFGRIPKREKQRMLLEMQSAMNNMMNNSQLQSQLYSSQSLPIVKPLPAGATEPTSDDAVPATSCSPSSSPHSSQSDSSLDPEPAASMDTSPSSASPSASDSSEEEVIGSVTRAHQETFMYNQEQSSLPSQASQPANTLGCGLAKTPTDNQTQERQGTWDHRKSPVTVARHSTLSLDPQDQKEVNQCPFGLSRTAATSHIPAYTHGAFRAPSTEGSTNGSCSIALWRGGNRMHLVS